MVLHGLKMGTPKVLFNSLIIPSAAVLGVLSKSKKSSVVVSRKILYVLTGNPYLSLVHQSSANRQLNLITFCLHTAGRGGAAPAPPGEPLVSVTSVTLPTPSVPGPAAAVCVCVYVCVCVCVYACVYIHTYIHMYTYVHIPRDICGRGRCRTCVVARY